MIGWIGNAFIISGMLAIAYKKRFGFMLGIVGSLLWCWRGFTTTQYDLLAIKLLVVDVGVFSWCKWGKSC